MEATLPNVPVQRFLFDRTRQAAPQVFEHMRDQIIAMALPPGTVLSRVDLAAQYGISQTPVRDALMRLSEEGLVDIFPQHATRVSPIDIALAQQAHFLRRSIELEVARALAESAEPALVESLRANIRRMRAVVEDGNYVEFTVLDQGFHRTLYEAAKVPDLFHLVRRQSGHLDRLRRLHLPIEGKTKAVVRDHVAIVDAIAAGDPVKAEACVRAHLSGTLSHLDAIRSRYATYLR
ncbi:transcriptional regulator [Pigmentiphaga litoralis]|jgi:DNA-binding GntR family transcriptional regulator|uniref:GntR family transcriptional regulator n=1 Tax=Pigmentiphaga litoralis TaxID=516702 RepID=UPI00167A4286|nr:GntR family transcriptional regulator [Pigmentiphaga litoralis]GGX12166.1 transcriptional regulator [Pigmentiphaga litoralis]